MPRAPWPGVEATNHGSTVRFSRSDSPRSHGWSVPNPSPMSTGWRHRTGVRPRRVPPTAGAGHGWILSSRHGSCTSSTGGSRVPWPPPPASQFWPRSSMTCSTSSPVTPSGTASRAHDGDGTSRTALVRDGVASERDLDRFRCWRHPRCRRSPCRVPPRFIPPLELPAMKRQALVCPPARPEQGARDRSPHRSARSSAQCGAHDPRVAAISLPALSSRLTIPAVVEHGADCRPTF